MMLPSFVVPPWLRAAWALLPWAASAGLGVALLLAMAQLRVARAECARDRATGQAIAARALAADETRRADAVETHERRTIAMQPIILDSKAAADAYAQTPAGRAPCLAADRVRSILAARHALFAFTPAGGAGSLPAGAPVADDAQQR